MKVFAGTDIGRVRQMNQDTYYVSEKADEPNIFLLADGMGGYAGGEIASNLAVHSVKEYVKNNWENTQKTEDKLLELIKNATQYANMIIYEKANQVKELEEMGTTIEICLIYNEKLYISHLGDSRIYAVSQNKIEKITSDHTYVEKLVKDGTITREEAKNHPKKHMLIKALGCTSFAEPDVFVRDWNPEEIIVLCSDGLTNMLTEDKIQDIILNEPICPEKKLINNANEAGGLDNITVILIKRERNSYK